MKKFLILAAAVFSSALFGVSVRLDIIGNGKVTLKDAISQGAAFATVPAKSTANIRRLVVITREVSAEWQKYEVSFVPEISGKITLRFHTPGSRNVNLIKPVLLDEVQISGGTLLNGGFELMNKGRLTNWHLGKKGKIITGDKVFKGKQSVQVIFSHGAAVQTLIATAGERVTVTFMARTAE